jgi:thiol-disulfide isomerase/thioredoxin
VVVLLVVAGVINHRRRQATMQQNQIVLEMTGSSSPKTESMGSLGSPTPEDDLRGKAAPAFALVDVTGKKVSLADYKGKPVVIDFWATYCAPCKLEMPWFEEFTAKYKDQGLVVLGVDQDDTVGKDEVAKAAKRVGATYPILMPDKKIAGNYKLGDYLPQTFFVDKNGTVVEEVIGGRSKDEIEADVKKIAGGV